MARPQITSKTLNPTMESSGGSISLQEAWTNKRMLGMVRRPLGSFEEFFWLIDQHRPAHFALAAQVQGITTVGQWRRALDIVQRRHPLLSVCIETNQGSRPHFRHVIAAPIPLWILQRTNATQRWELEMELELSIPFDPKQAPLIRAVLLHEDNQAILILVAHHSIADGLSIAFVIRDLMQVLSGTVIELLPVLPSHEEILGLTRRESGKPAVESNVAAPARPATYLREENLRPHIKTLRLSAAQTRTLRERAREERTTVHGALSAALALAARQNGPEFRNAPIRICSPIDTRKLLGLGDDCAALVVGGLVTIAPEMPDDLWSLARLSAARLAPARTLEGIRSSRNALHQTVSSGIDVPTAAAICAQGYAHEIMLTNLGNLPFETSFGALRLEAIWGPSVSARFEGVPTIGAATINGALCLLETSFSSRDSLLETTQQILMTAFAV